MKLKTGTYKLVIEDNGNECTYDAHGNLIYYKRPDGFEAWGEYDAHGRLYHYKLLDGHEAWEKYDAKGNRTHYKNSRGYELWEEYDEKGNHIHWWDSYGYERWYDSNGKHISKKEYDKLFGSRISNSCDGKIIEVEGKKYKLTLISEE